MRSCFRSVPLCHNVRAAHTYMHVQMLKSCAADGAVHLCKQAVDDGDTVTVGKHIARVLNVGGHTKGHIAYHFDTAGYLSPSLPPSLSLSLSSWMCAWFLQVHHMYEQPTLVFCMLLKGIPNGMLARTEIDAPPRGLKTDVWLIPSELVDTA